MRAGAEDVVLYEERQWASVRILALPIVAFTILGAVGCGLAAVAGMSRPWVSLPWFAGTGVVGAIFVWALQVTRRMQVRESGLLMSRNPVPFGDIESVRLVQGEEAKQIRNVISGAMRRRGGIIVSKREWRSIHGSWQQPWMRDAVFVQLKPSSRAVTDKWIVGTRHPQQLLQLIQDGMARAARAEVAAPTAPPVYAT